VKPAPRSVVRLVAVLIGIALLSARPCPAAVTGLTLEPSTLTVGLFSGGARIHITGRVPVGSEVVIIVRGGDAREVFSSKTRVGVIWMAGGKLEVSNVPAWFISISPRPLDAVLARPEIDRYRLDERALMSGIRITPAADDRAEIRDAFIQLKVEDGSYRNVTGGIGLGAAVAGEVPFSAELSWPPTAPPGAYRVLAHECRERAVVAVSEATFEVTEAGLAAGLKRLAEERGGLYGALAVAVTLSLGFGLDFALARLRRRRRPGRPRPAESTERDHAAVH
jgi:hypothetical protein